MGCPYYENPPHYSLDTIEKTITNFFRIIDHVRWYEFSGGETFLHKELPQMIQKIMEYRDRIDKLLIFTNATIWPPDGLQKVICDNAGKMLIMISHYGKLSPYADEISKWCAENNVECVIKKYYGDDQHFGGWLDYGDYSKLNRSAEELRKVFTLCGSTKMNGTFTTHGGQMHWCVPSARGMKLLKKIPNAENDFIDLFDESLSIQEQREKIKALSARDYITACDYCLGDFGEGITKRYPAAEQVK
jgi:hypothetical protein